MKFDIKYTTENYKEYYKFSLVTDKIFKDLLFSIFFLGFAVYLAFSKVSIPVAIVCAVFGLVLPHWSAISLLFIGKQLEGKKEDIAKTHISVDFTDTNVVYENLKEEAASEENKEEQKLFNLEYDNFQQVRELKNEFLFYVDRQTVIIVPKECIGDDIAGFKAFLESKIDNKRLMWLEKSFRSLSHVLEVLAGCMALLAFTAGLYWVQNGAETPVQIIIGFVLSVVLCGGISYLCFLCKGKELNFDLKSFKII